MEERQVYFTFKNGDKPTEWDTVFVGYGREYIYIEELDVNDIRLPRCIRTLDKLIGLIERLKQVKGGSGEWLVPDERESMLKMPDDAPVLIVDPNGEEVKE